LKVRDSGMPDESMWDGFFNPDAILRTFGIDTGVGDLVEFGCGYGTFTLATARMVSGTVFALDIEPEMITLVQEKCRRAGIVNVQAVVRDFVAQGSHLPEVSMDAALLFNILHHDEPVALMSEAWRVLKPGGTLVIAVRPKEFLERVRFTTLGFTAFEDGELGRLLAAAGFDRVVVERHQDRDMGTVQAIAHKPGGAGPGAG